MAKKGDADRPTFTETLRAIDDSNLDVYEFRLMVHIWRVGVSWENTRTLAAKCNMSVGKVYQVQKALIEKGVLVHEERGGRIGLTVAIRSPHEQIQQSNSSVCSPDEQECSPHEQNVHDMNAILNQPYKSTNEDYAPSPPPTPAPSPYEAIQEHFRTQTNMLPNDRAGTYERDWRKPLEAILELTANDPAAAIALIDRALAVARGDNEARKVYTVTCPRSLMSIAANLAATRQTAATAADDDSLWQRAIQAITRREFSDERLKAAIHAIGGSNRLAMANGHDTPTLKRQLAAAYRQALSPTG